MVGNRKTNSSKRPSTGPLPPTRRLQANTYSHLLDSTMELIKASGVVPSVAEVARHACVSRATAYRYFASRSALIAAVMDTSLGPVREFESNYTSGPDRVRDLFKRTFPRFQEFEAQMRAAVQLSLQHWAQERSGALNEEPFRRGHRVAIMAKAIKPMKSILSKVKYDRLHHALTVVYGIETWFILKDIWGLSDRNIEHLAIWMADTLVQASLAESLQSHQNKESYIR